MPGAVYGSTIRTVQPKKDNYVVYEQYFFTNHTHSVTPVCFSALRIKSF